jgi:hypothetical protein
LFEATLILANESNLTFLKSGTFGIGTEQFTGFGEIVVPQGGVELLGWYMSLSTNWPNLPPSSAGLRAPEAIGPTPPGTFRVFIPSDGTLHLNSGPTGIPEPGTLFLMGIPALGLLALGRFRRRQS